MGLYCLAPKEGGARFRLTPFDFELADLLVKLRFEVFLFFVGFDALVRKNLRQFVEQLLFPLRQLVWMNAMAGTLHQRRIVDQSFLCTSSNSRWTGFCVW